MNTKVKATLLAHNMIKGGETVIVALSGGADSAVLLDIILKLSKEYNLTVAAAHVNHQLRGDESVRDENFVRELCAQRGIRLFVKSVDVNALAKDSGEGFELAGRKVRYEFFESLAQEQGALVATAHTLSDAAETALMNIARGTSLSGLCSIPYVRGCFIRPLLDVTRAEVEAYAEENYLSFVNDSTNFDAEICNRNKVRHNAVPVLKEINPAFEQNFMRLRAQLNDVDSFMRVEANKLIELSRKNYGYDAEIIGDASSAVKFYALNLIAEQAGASVEQRHLELINTMLKSGGSVNLYGGYNAVVKQGMLRFVENNQHKSFCTLFENNSMLKFGGKEYLFKETNVNKNVHKKLATSLVDCDKISGDTRIRTRQAGDRFALKGRGITKDLRKLQNELKIPAEQRDAMLLIANGSIVLWAEGIGVSADGVCESNKGISIEIRKDF